MARRRLDQELVRRGLVASRQLAREAIESGRVTVGGAPATKPARQVDAGEPIEILGEGPRFVSRGGEKLAAALERFDIDVGGTRALDAGASTGGFTDCLLQNGSAHVTAVDVGYGQLDVRLRDDPRVDCRERTNARHLEPGDIAPAPDVVVADLSFIGLGTVLPALVGVAAADARFVLLVKPQFEAGREEVSKGRGVIRDPEIWRRVLVDAVAACAAAEVGIMGVMASPIRGPEGNREFLVYGRKLVSDAPEVAGVTEADIDAVVDSTAAEEAAR